MTNTCSTCLHWNRLDHPYERIDRVLVAGAPWGECLLISTSREDHHVRSRRAYTLDSSEWEAWLNVRGDFGCVEHEEKPA